MSTSALEWLGFRLLISLMGVAAVTFAAYAVLPVNATTAAFAYLLLVLLIASTWGFIESAVASVAATLAFNLFFLPPVGTLTIADPQNWVALFSFLTTALVASRLSTAARQRAREANERREDMERLYTFSRAILLIDEAEPFAKQLTLKLAEIFHLDAAVLYDRHANEFFRAGPADFEGLDEQIRQTAQLGVAFSDAGHHRLITAVRLGQEPIASLALQRSRLSDVLVQGISNLIAIGLERARAQDLARQVEVSRRSELLRSTLLDAMAHEFKTPLTSIKAATTSLLYVSDQPEQERMELLKIADEEAEYLNGLIDDTIEMAQLETSQIQVQPEPLRLGEIVEHIITSMARKTDPARIELRSDAALDIIAADQRLIKLAIKQLLDNAVKYSPPSKPISVAIRNGAGTQLVEVTDYGKGIPASEHSRIFERFWRSPSVIKQMPGSGLGLSIAHAIARAHNGDLTVTSRPGETTFRLTLPAGLKGEEA